MQGLPIIPIRDSPSMDSVYTPRSATPESHSHADDIDPQLVDLCDSPLSPMLQPLSQLEHILGTIELQSRVRRDACGPTILIYYQTLLTQQLKSVGKARLKISLSLALIAHYRTSSSLSTALWSYLGLNNSMDWEGISAIMRISLEESTSNLLEEWNNTDAGDLDDDEQRGLDEGNRKRIYSQFSECVTGFLLIDGRVCIATMHNQIVSYKSIESEEGTIDMNSIYTDTSNLSGSTIHVSDFSSLKEETRGSYSVTLTLETEQQQKTKILVPYGHRTQQKKWIESIQMSFIRGRIQYMSKEENRGHETIQENAVEAISSFTSLSKQIRVSLMQEEQYGGVIGATLTAMREFPHNYNIQYWGLGAINNFTLKVDYGKMIAGREGAVQVLSDAVRHFSNDTPLQIRACLTVQTLASGVEYNKRDQELQMLALGSLSNLLTSDDVVHEVSDEGVQCITKSMLTFPNNFNIQFYGMGALVNLTHNDHCTKALMSQETMLSVMDAINTFNDNELLIHRGLCYIHSVVKSDEGMDLVVPLIPDDFLSNISATFVQNEHIQLLVEECTPYLKSRWTDYK
ncbi:hypothetical protein PROFUN_09624 [Planoprotostelium fungivorum]|uniref:LRRK2 ARM repeat domain-containing protein n=1 Tax=Planoprotostelium fungivorum TaxID=1890364 RepID=A0A2P6MNV0_9EUKA|nr:hypothetical protein PROFUN_09624 [Planoprotostelium fungivorum]